MPTTGEIINFFINPSAALGAAFLGYTQTNEPALDLRTALANGIVQAYEVGTYASPGGGWWRDVGGVLLPTNEEARSLVRKYLSDTAVTTLAVGGIALILLIFFLKKF